MRWIKYLVTARFQFQNQLMVGDFNKVTTEAAFTAGVVAAPASTALVRKQALAKIDRRFGGSNIFSTGLVVLHN
jgi:hypothetical protein